MMINKTRLATATSILWAVLALPLTQSLPNTYGFTNFVFWYAILLYPVWITYGWRWISENAPIPFKLWGGLTVWAGIAALIMTDISGYRDLYWLPMVATASLITLTVIFDGWHAVHKTPRDAILAAWRRPPVWLVVLAVMLSWLATQTFINMFTPKVNLILLAGAGAAWLGHLTFKK